jgi:MoxR-like ATPase
MKNYKNFTTKRYDSINEASLMQNFSKVYTFITKKFKDTAWYYLNKFLDKIGVLRKNNIKIIDFTNAQQIDIPTDITEGYDFKEIAKLFEQKEIGREATDKVPNVCKRDFVDALKIHFGMKKPFLVWGAPGVGKTQIIETLAEELGIQIIVITLSVKEPTDIAGVPSVIAASKAGGLTVKMKEGEEEMEENATIFNLPLFFPRNNGPNDRGGILFFDELNQASQPVLSACLTLIESRRMDKYTLPSKWVIFGAANRKEDVPTVTRLGKAMANRLGQVNFAPTLADWTEWAMDPNNKLDKRIIEHLKDLWPTIGDLSEEPTVDTRVVAFLRTREDLLHKMGEAKSDAPWPSPRSWARGCELMAITAAVVKAEGKVATETQLKRALGEWVGIDAAEEYFSFLELISAMSEADIIKVYTDPINAPLPEKVAGGKGRIDKSYAILTAIAYYKYNKAVLIKEFYNLIDYAIKLNEGELAIYLVKLIMETHKEPPAGVTGKEIEKYLCHKNPLVSGHDSKVTGTGKIEGLKKLQTKYPNFYDVAKDDKPVSADQLKSKA